MTYLITTTEFDDDVVDRIRAISFGNYESARNGFDNIKSELMLASSDDIKDLSINETSMFCLRKDKQHNIYDKVIIDLIKKEELESILP